MKRGNITLASVVAVGLWLAGSAALTPINHACAAQAQVSYSEDIAPVFRGWCASCHAPGGEGEKASGLDLSTYEGLTERHKIRADGGPPESPTRATSWCPSTARPRSHGVSAQAAAKLSSPEHLVVDFRGREEQLTAIVANALRNGAELLELRQGPMRIGAPH